MYLELLIKYSDIDIYEALIYIFRHVFSSAACMVIGNCSRMQHNSQILSTENKYIKLISIFLFV